MAQSEAPHTRGFLFADLRGYTRFVETHGDKAASELLSAYRAVVRAAVAESNGAEIRTEGDGFYVVFPSASSAIRCGLAILEAAATSTAAAGAPLPVGIGIHAGETEDSAEGFVGSAVNIAARVCALASPGELLVTETVRSLVRTSMPLSIEPRGRRHLKGIREPIALFAIRPSGAAPRSRARLLRSLAARSLERRPLAAGFAALIGVAIVATVLLAIGLLTNTVANPGAGLLGPASGSGGATGSASEPDTFPNAAETKLLARIDQEVAPRCGRAPLNARPTYNNKVYHGDIGLRAPRLLLPTIAGIACHLGGGGLSPDVVYFWLTTGDLGFGNGPGTPDTVIYSDAGYLKIPSGDCSKQVPAYGHWELGRTAGVLLCLLSAPSGDAVFKWTYDGEPIIAVAIRSDGDAAELFRWWQQHARFLHP